MNFSSFFRQPNPQHEPEIPCDSLLHRPVSACDSSGKPAVAPQPTSSHHHLPHAIPTKIEFLVRAWCLPTQLAWINDPWPLRIWEKSRQVGATKTDALDSVLKASPAGAKYDVWVSSRDELQASLYLEDCREWANFLHLAAKYIGRVILDKNANTSAYVLQFANGRRIHCLSSNPNAFAGKRGHVKLDEFALHPDQRALYKVAKPVTQWGGTLSIMSTHRGPATLFNQFIRDIRKAPANSPWHLFSYPIQKAVDEGIVERINEKKDTNESREEFLERIHR